MQVSPLWRVGLCAVLALMLGGCETLSKSPVAEVLKTSSGPTTLDFPPPPTDASVWEDPDLEHLKNRAEGFGLVPMPRMEKYLNGLLEKVRKEAGVPHWPGKVYITANSGLDAYTQASGNIYISLGYLKEAESEDELFGLIAHEFAHSYLEYDALRKGILKTDMVANVGTTLSFLGKGGKLDQLGKFQDGAAAIKGNKAAETALAVMTAYQVSRNVLAPVWKRSQEHAADDMAVQMSIRLNYSVQDGLVKVLERQVSHEQKRDEQKKQQRDVLRKQFEAVRTQLASHLTSGAKVSSEQISEGVLNGFLGELSFAGEDIVGQLTRDHPDVDKRIERVHAVNDRLMEGRDPPEPRSKEWLKLKNERYAQRMFESYQNATLAQNALTLAEDRDRVRRFARQSLTQETQGHAMPALMVMQAGDERTAMRALQANMNSPRNRAWRSYVMYAEQKMKEGRTTEAKRVLDQGFQHFQPVPNAWVEYISLQVKLKDEKKAQSLAQACDKRFPGYGPACGRAADPQRAAPKGPVNFGWIERLLVR